MKFTEETLNDQSFDQCRIMAFLPRGSVACFPFEYTEDIDGIKLLSEISDHLTNMGYPITAVFIPAIIVLKINTVGKTYMLGENIQNIIHRMGIFRDAVIIPYNPKGHNPKINF